jgi:branched-chain amino acid transport system permease protein
LAAAVAAAVVGFPIMRLAGLAASLATFALLVIINVIARNWDEGTRGTESLFGLPGYTTLSVALVFALVTIAAAHLLERSPLGLRLRASRDDVLAAKAAGISVTTERFLAFAVSAFFVGIGGFLFAQFLGSFNPDAFFTRLTLLTLAMLIVGGLTSLVGAVMGCVLISALAAGLLRLQNGIELGPVELRTPAGLVDLGLAASMLLVLIFRPAGLFGSQPSEMRSTGSARPSWRRRGDARGSGI